MSLLAFGASPRATLSKLSRISRAFHVLELNFMVFTDGRLPKNAPESCQKSSILAKV